MASYKVLLNAELSWRDRIVEDVNGPYDSFDAAAEQCVGNEIHMAKKAITNNAHGRRYSTDRAYTLLDWVGACVSGEELERYMGLLAFCMESSAFHPFSTTTEKVSVLSKRQPGTILISLSTSKERTLELWRKSDDGELSVETYAVSWQGGSAFLTRETTKDGGVVPVPSASFFPHGHACSICIEDFDYKLQPDQLEHTHRNTEIVAVLPCNHLFHRTCIDTWKSSAHGRLCPNCNGTISAVVNSLPAGFGQSLHGSVVCYKKHRPVVHTTPSAPLLETADYARPSHESLGINWPDHTLHVDGFTSMFTASEGAYDMFTVPFVGGPQLTELSEDGTERVKHGVVLVPWHKRGLPSSSNTKLFLILDTSGSMSGKGKDDAMKFIDQARTTYNRGGYVFPWGSRDAKPVSLEDARSIRFYGGTLMSSALNALDNATNVIKEEMAAMTDDERASTCFHIVFTTDGVIEDDVDNPQLNRVWKASNLLRRMGHVITDDKQPNKNETRTTLRLVRQMGHVRVSVVGMGRAINSSQLASVAENTLEAHDLMEVSGSVSLADVPQPQIVSMRTTAFYRGVRLSSYVCDVKEEGYKSVKDITVNGSTPVILYLDSAPGEHHRGSDAPFDGFSQQDVHNTFKATITTCASVGLAYTNMRTVLIGSVRVTLPELQDLQDTITDHFERSMMVLSQSSVPVVEHTRQMLYLGIYRMIKNVDTGRKVDAVDEPGETLGSDVRPDRGPFVGKYRVRAVKRPVY